MRQHYKSSILEVLLADIMAQHRLDCQQDLSNSITKLNKKSKLFVIREAPQTVLPKIFKSWKISHLVFEKDTDAYARDRDREVEALAKKAGVKVIKEMGRTLYDPEELVKRNGNKPTMSISQVEHVRQRPFESQDLSQVDFHVNAGSETPRSSSQTN